MYAIFTTSLFKLQMKFLRYQFLVFSTLFIGGPVVLNYVFSNSINVQNNSGW